MTNPSIHDPIPGRTVWCVAGAWDYMNWTMSVPADRMEDATFLLFEGGSDVHPSLYGKRAHYSSYHDVARDRYEVEVFKKARALGKPMVGVCRGAQFGNVMSGGLLVQDQANPYGRHPMQTFDGKTIVMSSSHHQSMLPWGLPADEYRLLAWTNGVSPYHHGEFDGDEQVVGVAPEDKEVEAAYFVKTRFLCIQGHPEYLHPSRSQAEQETISWCRGLVDMLLAGAL